MQKEIEFAQTEVKDARGHDSRADDRRRRSDRDVEARRSRPRQRAEDRRCRSARARIRAGRAADDARSDHQGARRAWSRRSTPGRSRSSSWSRGGRKRRGRGRGARRHLHDLPREDCGRRCSTPCVETNRSCSATAATGSSISDPSLLQPPTASRRPRSSPWSARQIPSSRTSTGAPGAIPARRVSGVRIERPDGTLIEEFGESIGVATNNVAEYRGLLAALERALARGSQDRHHPVRFAPYRPADARHVQGQTPGLLPLYAKARLLAHEIGRVTFEHVRRESNTHADRLANTAMDEVADR